MEEVDMKQRGAALGRAFSERGMTAFLAAGLLIVGLLAGCATIDTAVSPSMTRGGQVVAYLNGPERASIDISFDITTAELVGEDGSRRSILEKPLTVNSLRVTGRQLLMAETFIPEGRYVKLLVSVDKGKVSRKDRVASLSMPEGPVELPVNVTVSAGRSAPIFLAWNADASMVEGFRFSPAFSVRGAAPELSALLVYITNEDSNNVSVIHRQTGEVVSTVMVGKRPRGTAAGTIKERFRIYVANSGSDSVSIIDPTTNTVEHEVPVRFGREPEGIAVAKASSATEFIFVANYSSNTISIINAVSRQEVGKVAVGNGPIAIAADPPIESVLESRFLSPEDLSFLRNYRNRFVNVYVANKNSNDLSVIRVDARTGLVEEVFSLKVEWSPIAVAADAARGKVYVANQGSDKLSVIDVIQLVKGNRAAAVSTMQVGGSLSGVLADPTLDRLYLLKDRVGEIEIIRPPSSGEVLRAAIPTVVGRIPVGIAPRSLAIDPEGRKLYVVNRGGNSVTVIDKTTRTEERVIPVGRRPYGVALLGQ